MLPSICSSLLPLQSLTSVCREWKMERIWSCSRGISGQNQKNGSCVWLCFSAHHWVLVGLGKSWASHGQVTGKSLSGSITCELHPRVNPEKIVKGRVYSWTQRSWKREQPFCFREKIVPVDDPWLSLSLPWLFADLIQSLEHLLLAFFP